MAKWSVAGYDDTDGNWHDAESHPDEAPTDQDLLDATEIVIHYLDDDEVSHYWTEHSDFGWTGDELDGIIADAEEAGYVEA